VELGLALPQFDYSVPGQPRLPWATVVECARRAELAGYDSVWLADHLFLTVDRYGGPPGEFWGYDPIVTLAGLARATTRVRLGTLVLCAQLRPPAVLAKALASLDVVSRGRLIVGIGAGWFEPEYRAAGIPFERPGVRVRQLGEAVAIITGVLGGSAPVRFGGEHYQAAGAGCLPPPAQRPRPPVWVGGRGDKALEVAAGVDGWNMRGWDVSAEDYRERLSVFEGACRRLGRDPDTVTRSVNQRFDGSVPAMRGRMSEWRDLGVTTLIAGLGALPFSLNETDDIERVASARP
jgi:probable F420-dependent oxidoreductase